MRRPIRLTLRALACCLLAASPASADWLSLGLDGRSVERVRANDGFLYACTDAGLYRLASDSPSSGWSLIGFAGEAVLDLVAIGPQTLLAARTLSQAPGDTVSLYRSTDAGDTWHAWQNGFGVGASRQARRLLRSGDGTLFAASSRIERSDDAGATWNVAVQAQVLNAIEASPADPQTIWAGGETLIFWPYVLKSSDDGGTWQPFYPFAGGDNAVDAIAGHPSDPDVVYLGMEGRVMKSEDGGANWITVTSPDPSAYTFGMAIRSFPPLEVFAAGASSPPDPRGVVFHRSVDGGETWETVSHAADAGFGVRHLLLAAGVVVETLYVATYNGVYRYTKSTLDAPLPTGAVIAWQCRPNPFGSTATLELDLPSAGPVSVEVLDLSGRRIAELVAESLPSGPHRLRLDARGWRPGIYFGRFQAGGHSATLRLVHWE